MNGQDTFFLTRAMVFLPPPIQLLVVPDRSRLFLPQGGAPLITTEAEGCAAWPHRSGSARRTPQRGSPQSPCRPGTPVRSAGSHGPALTPATEDAAAPSLDTARRACLSAAPPPRLLG